MDEVKTKKDYHWLRKLGHLVPGLVIFFLLDQNILSQENIRLFLARLLIVVALFEFLRLRFAKINELYIMLFGKVLRKSELSEYSGTISYILGLFVVIFFFPKTIAALSILFLSVGDPSASAIGLYFSKRDKNFKIYQNKTIMGFIGMLLMNFIVALIYLLFNDYSFIAAFTVSFLGSLVTALAESFLGEKLNDNLVIPLSGAFSLFLLSSIFSLIKF